MLKNALQLFYNILQKKKEKRRHIYLKKNLFRFNDKVTIESELSDVRRKQTAEWETTKHHLKLAKARTSLDGQEKLKMDDNESLSHAAQSNQANHVVLHV